MNEDIREQARKKYMHPLTEKTGCCWFAEYCCDSARTDNWYQSTGVETLQFAGQSIYQGKKEWYSCPERVWS